MIKMIFGNEIGAACDQSRIIKEQKNAAGDRYTKVM